MLTKLKSDKDLAKLLLKSVDYVFLLLRKVLLKSYSKEILHVTKEDLVEKEFIL